MRRFTCTRRGALVVALALLTGGPALAQDKTRVRIIFPTPVTSYMLPYLIPKDQGWFDQRGVEIEEIYVSGDANAARAMLSGGADVALVGMHTLFDLAINGAAVKSFLSWQPIVDYLIVAKKGRATSIKELGGTIISAGSPAEMSTAIPRLMLKKHGVDPASARFVNIGGHAARLQAVIAGKADATMVNTMTAKRGELDGAVTVLSTVSADFPNLGYGFLVANADTLKTDAKRRALQVLVEGSILGARRTLAEPDLATQILHKRLPDLPLELVLAVVQELNRMGVWGIDGGLDPEIVRFTAEVERDLGSLSRLVAADEVYDRSLIDVALGKLGTK